MRRTWALFTVVSLSAGLANASVKTLGSCQVIDRPGSYQLSRAITATAEDLTPLPEQPDGVPTTACIVIAADFVTLDLQGYSITGPGTALSGANHTRGISTDEGRRGAKVHSGAVTNFTHGVFLRGASHTVEHVNASNNNFIGISASNAEGGLNGHRIVGNTANQNGQEPFFPGIGISVTCPAVVTENVAAANSSGINIIASDATCTRFGNSPLP